MSSDRPSDASRETGGADPGSLVMIVGPSGAGKDTLMQMALAALTDAPGRGPRLRVARRVVTRPASAHEDHDTLSDEVFAAEEAAGGFALSWRAHGLSYGITQAEADCRSDVVVANVSRMAVEQGRRLTNRSYVVLITAPPQVLGERIKARGRDAAAGSRQDRQDLDRLVADTADLVIVNAGTPAEGAAPLIAFLGRLLDARPAGGEQD